MKKRIILGVTVIVSAFMLVMTTSPSFAFFTDRDEAVGSTNEAGYLEITLISDLPGYGVPGDVLEGGYITIQNNGTVDMEYTLSLTADADTAKLLESGQDAIMLYEGDRRLPAEIAPQPNGSLLVTLNGQIPLLDEQKYTYALSISGLLTDGNEFQSRSITLQHQVKANQLLEKGGDGQ